MTKTELLKTILLNKDNQIFKCNFIKENGEIREMICEVEKPHPTKENLVIVYDLTIDQFRNVNLDTVIDITINREKLTFQKLTK